jgi:hypothetical protein
MQGDRWRQQRDVLGALHRLAEFFGNGGDEFGRGDDPGQPGRAPERFYDSLEWLYGWTADACLDP